jgi:hypothetical protein
MNKKDKQRLNDIATFLQENDIGYSTTEEGIFDIADKPIQVRYANSNDLKIGYKKRFGYDGVAQNYCYAISKAQEDAGVRVIWWRDFEADNVRKNNVIKSYILSSCGKVRNKIYARDTEVKEIPSKELRAFLDTNCFYGYRSASLNLGLYLKKDVGDLKEGTLVMMWSAGHAFFGKKLYDLEIIRAATLLNTQVLGGASKLFAKIKSMESIRCGKNDVAFNSLVFYVDYDHNSGNSLKTLGFKLWKYSNGGFMNINLETGEAFNRKPMMHKQIMQMMKDGKVVSTPLAGVKTFVYCKSDDYSKYEMV